MLPNLKLYGLIGVGVGFLLLGAYAGYQKLQVAKLEKQIVDTELAHAKAISNALADQAKVLHESNKEEREKLARLAATRDKLLAEVRRLNDYTATLAESLRVLLNGMFERASSAVGGVSEAPAGTIRSTSTEDRTVESRIN